jgi:hypothetical protein
VFDLYGSESTEDVCVFYCRSIWDPVTSDEVGRSYPQLAFSGWDTNQFKKSMDGVTVSQKSCPLGGSGEVSRMARQPRFEYPGAIYHVMARGNGGDDVFVTDDDRKAFLFRLGHVCASHGWKVHAWVIMGMLFWTIV